MRRYTELANKRYAARVRSNRAYIACGLIIALVCASEVRAGDFFVITDTFRSQDEAQTRAAVVGGWVLDTDAYSKLSPDHFAVVRGPYMSAEVAESELRELKQIKKYATAYVKDAGDLRFPMNLVPGSVRGQVLAALLGELSIRTSDHPGAANPCEPQEPYQDVSISFVSLDRTYDDRTGRDGVAPRRLDLDLGGFWLIKRTGEIQRMRVCAE